MISTDYLEGRRRGRLARPESERQAKNRSGRAPRGRAGQSDPTAAWYSVDLVRIGVFLVTFLVHWYQMFIGLVSNLYRSHINLVFHVPLTPTRVHESIVEVHVNRQASRETNVTTHRPCRAQFGPKHEVWS